MIDFDPSVKDVLMPSDLAMKFMIWAAFFNGLWTLFGTEDI